MSMLMFGVDQWEGDQWTEEVALYADNLNHTDYRNIHNRHGILQPELGISAEVCTHTHLFALAPNTLDDCKQTEQKFLQ